MIKKVKDVAKLQYENLNKIVGYLSRKKSFQFVREVLKVISSVFRRSTHDCSLLRRLSSLNPIFNQYTRYYTGQNIRRNTFLQTLQPQVSSVKMHRPVGLSSSAVHLKK
jgi:hypothetical protein